MLQIARPFILILLAGAVFGPTQKAGEAAPQFTLRGTAGADVALKQFAGKSKVVLVFYRGYW